MAAKKKKESRSLALVGAGSWGEVGLKWLEKHRQLIKRTICSHAEDDEFELFMVFCGQNNVNPLNGEAWFQIRFSKVKNYDGSDKIDPRTQKPIYERKPVFGLTIKAVRNRLEERPDYLGHEVQVIYTNDTFSYDAAAKVVNHVVNSFNKRERGVPLGAWGKLDRKEKMPMVKLLYLSERFQEKSYNWKGMGDTMISKCCEMDLIRAAYSKQFGSIYTPEEMEGRDDEQLDPSKLEPVPAVVKTENTKVAESVKAELLPQATLTPPAQEIVDKFAKEPEVPAEVTIEEEDQPDDAKGSPFVIPEQFDQLQNICQEHRLSVGDFCKLIKNEFKVDIRKLSQVRKPMMPILMRKFSQVAEGALNLWKDTMRFEGPPDPKSEEQLNQEAKDENLPF
jgi:hypothetical protein